MKTKYCLLLLIISQVGYTQTDYKFYKSLDDYYDNKFIPGYDILDSWRDSDFHPERLDLIINNEDKKKVNISDFPSDFYSASEGQLWRRYKNKSYIILAHGEYCYYITPGPTSKQFYSETISGPVKKIQSEILEKRLKEKGLWEEFEKAEPKRDKREHFDDYYTRFVLRNIEFINRLNKT